MLQIPLQGMRDGQRSIECQCSADELQSAFTEFQGTVEVRGEIRKAGRRLTLDAVAYCDASLTCDYTTTEFTERIEAPFHCDFILDTELFNERSKESADASEFELIALHEEQKTIDVTDIVRQELAVNLPLKRVSPEVRDKPLEVLVENRYLTSASSTDEVVDERWAALQNISLPEGDAKDER